ncbi:hypothetical protein [Halalkalibacter sp. APA_J-10(15)]|nr:hypothetical protein [Halalkalibacter sp. APA_J-10(15)]
MQCVETKKVMEVISGKWEPVIWFHLLYGGTMHVGKYEWGSFTSSI